MRNLARIAGFRVGGIDRNRYSAASVLLGVSYPVLCIFNLLAYLQTRRRYRHLDQRWVQQTLREVMALNLNPYLLFSKKLFFELDKVCELDQAGAAFVKQTERVAGSFLVPLHLPGVRRFANHCRAR
jgi:hypothetical protein